MSVPQICNQKKKAVASFILKESENAVVTHFCMHNLNLSISALGRTDLIDNVIESYKNTIFFFKLSPKKETSLNYITEIRRLGNNRRQILIGMCKNKCSERDLTYEHIYLHLLFIVEALEIINSIHAEMESFEKKVH